MDNMNIHQQNSNETVNITKQPVNNDNQQQNTMYQQQVNMGYQGQPNIGYQYQQQPNMMYQQPMNTEYANEHEANLLAGVSLACIIGSRVMLIVSTIVNVLITSEESVIWVLLNLFSGLTGIISLAGLVTMIITRIKYPKNKLGKAAMWTYIIITALELLAVIVFTVACIAAGVAFIEACGNCPG